MIVPGEHEDVKRRSFAHIDFIGELFKLDLLSENIIHEWYFRWFANNLCEITFKLFFLIIMLWSNSVAKLLDKDHVEEFDLERLIYLLKRVGGLLDCSNNKAADSNFVKIQSILQERDFSEPIRFELMVINFNFLFFPADSLFFFFLFLPSFSLPANSSFCFFFIYLFICLFIYF